MDTSNVIVRMAIKRQINGMPTTKTLSHQGTSSWMECQARGVDPNNPFKSAKQRKYLFAKKPAVAKKFVNDTKKGIVKDPSLTAKQMRKGLK